MRLRVLLCDALQEYVADSSSPGCTIRRELRAKTTEPPLQFPQHPPEQGHFLSPLLTANGIRPVLGAG